MPEQRFNVFVPFSWNAGFILFKLVYYQIFLTSPIAIKGEIFGQRSMKFVPISTNFYPRMFQNGQGHGWTWMGLTPPPTSRGITSLSHSIIMLLLSFNQRESLYLYYILALLLIFVPHLKYHISPFNNIKEIERILTE